MELLHQVGHVICNYIVPGNFVTFFVSHLCHLVDVFMLSPFSDIEGASQITTCDNSNVKLKYSGGKFIWIKTWLKH